MVLLVLHFAYRDLADVSASIGTTSVDHASMGDDLCVAQVRSGRTDWMSCML